MSDMQDYESRLRAKIEDQGKSVELHFRDLRQGDAHPLSNDYKMALQLGLLSAGHLMGLLAALQELTGDGSTMREYEAKVQGWISR